MTIETVWRDTENNYRITRSNRPSEATLKLLGQTIWGSRRTQYRILDIEAKLARLRDPSFFVLSEDGREVCVFVLDKCRKRISGQMCDACHFVMASTVPERQNEGLAGILIEHVRRYCIAAVGKPGLGFAYVEGTTEFSLRLSAQIGHSVEADIPITLFTRLFPRNDPQVGLMRPAEADFALSELDRLYADHEMTDFAAALNPEACFVYREAGSIIAAAQVELLKWSVVSIPGVSGAFLMNAMPRIPGLNRFLDLKELRILRLSHLFFADRSESALFALLEACLHAHGSKIGLILLDARSPVLRRILQTGKMGILSRSISGSAKLRIDVVGMEEDMLTDLRTKPVMVSAADVV
ncbi:MAG: hypothetical protein PVI41_11910 [Roseobacter sp.]|jgi:hypothetical protein